MKKGARLGQHFLKAPWAARALARAIPLAENDLILEIGPGKGALTRELLLTGKRIVAIEKDETLVKGLHERFADEIRSGALTIIKGDVRDLYKGAALVDSPRPHLGKQGYVVAANIPYYITGEIIRQFLTAKSQPRAMALLVQKEVAQRIVSKRESILSLSVKAYGTPRIVKRVPRGNFSPAPNVDSAIILIKNISRAFFKDIDESAFFKVVRAGFSSKRKLLANNLAALFGKEKTLAALSACGVMERSRAEDVPLHEWKCLAQELATRV